MLIQKKAFLDCLSKALLGISSNSVSPGAEAFYFENGYLYVYNEAVSVMVVLPEDCKGLLGAISAKELTDTVKKLKDEEFSVFVKEDFWKIRCGKATIELVILEDFPLKTVKGLISKITENGEWLDVTPEFLECCSMATFGKNNSKLTGVYFYSNYIVSTDEMRINFLQSNVDISDDFWMEENALKLLSKVEGLTRMNVGEHWVHFESKDKIYYSIKKIKGDYPFSLIKNRVDLHNKEQDDIQGKMPEGFAQSIAMAAPFCQSFDSLASMKLTFTISGIQIYAEKNIGKYYDEIEWTEPIYGTINKKVSTLVDYKMVNSGLSNMKSFYIKKISYKHGEMISLVFENKYGIQIIGSLEEE